jgi:hypothetical protein
MDVEDVDYRVGWDLEDWGGKKMGGEVRRDEVKLMTCFILELLRLSLIE